MLKDFEFFMFFLAEFFLYVDAKYSDRKRQAVLIVFNFILNIKTVKKYAGDISYC